MVKTFCIRRLTTGSCMPCDAPTYTVTHCIMAGTVTSVIIELKAVSDTDNATSPFANFEKILLDEPPGQQAINITPIKNIGGKEKKEATANDTNGNSTSCPNKPTNTARGRFAINTKSDGRRVKPKSNINNVRIGNTIKILFIY